MRIAYATILGCLLACSSWGLEVPERVPSYTQVVVKHQADCFLRIEPADKLSYAPKADAGITVFVAPPGAYKVMEVYKDADKWVCNEAVVVIGDQTPPVPPSPEPKPPTPDPKPPTPDPQPEPPAPSSDLRVMIIHETGDVTKPNYPSAAMNSVAVRSYLNLYCPRDKDGLPQWRIWDDDLTDEQIKYDSPDLQKLFRKAKTDSGGKLPWIAITSPAGGLSVALPSTEAALLDLLKRYGG